MAVNEVVIVVGESVVRVTAEVWDLFHSCAGAMIEGGKHATYYSGIADDETLNSVTTLYRNTALMKA